MQYQQWKREYEKNSDSLPTIKRERPSSALEIFEDYPKIKVLKHSLPQKTSFQAQFYGRGDGYSNNRVAQFSRTYGNEKRNLESSKTQRFFSYLYCVRQKQLP